MPRTFRFKNRDGLHGIFQKDDDIVLLHMENGLFSIKDYAYWSDWLAQPKSKKNEDAASIPSEESISFFLSRHCETINHEAFEVTEVINAGQYYPRIYRGNTSLEYNSPAFHQDARAYQNTQSTLDSLFNYIDPDPSNFKCFGHKVRELLILACTEVEYLLYKGLTENGYENKKTYSTNDYIKCLELYKLDQWMVKLVRYPTIKTFTPFKNWDASKPTKSLAWYDAYNAVKHNRGDKIAEANFEHAIDSVAALHILLQAQYGYHIFDRMHQRTEEKSLFITTNHPSWSPSEMSTPIFDSKQPKHRWNQSVEYFKVNP